MAGVMSTLSNLVHSGGNQFITDPLNLANGKLTDPLDFFPQLNGLLPNMPSFPQPVTSYKTSYLFSQTGFTRSFFTAGGAGGVADPTMKDRPDELHPAVKAQKQIPAPGAPGGPNLTEAEVAPQKAPPVVKPPGPRETLLAGGANESAIAPNSRTNPEMEPSLNVQALKEDYASRPNLGTSTVMKVPTLSSAPAVQKQQAANDLAFMKRRFSTIGEF